MKKKQIIKLVFWVGFLCFFISCDENDKNSTVFVSELNGTYTNKPASTEESLVLLYSGNEIYGKDIYFKFTDEFQAEITLFNILPGEKETVIQGVEISKNENNYFFSGTTGSENFESYLYEGEIEKGKLYFKLSEININSNLLTQASEWKVVQAQSSQNMGEYYHYYESFYLVWDPAPQGSSIISQVPSIIRKLLEKIVYSTLRDITFSQDGNFTANYATFPDNMNFITDIFVGQGYPNRPDEDWIELPDNIISYYVKSNKLYIIPDAEMILRTLMNSAGTRVDSGEINIDIILELYSKITEWCTTGLELTIKEIPQQPYTNDSGDMVKNEGDIILILDKEQLTSFFPVLPYVKGLLSEDVLNTPTPIGRLTVGELIDVLVDGLLNSDRFELGIFLNKSHN